MEVPAICIVCGFVPAERDLNGLRAYACPACGLMWRASFDVPAEHYEDADGGFDAGKEEMQLRNARQRIALMRPYMTLDGICDIGASKGVFLKALQEAGATRMLGIEPNRVQVEAAEQGGLPMELGLLPDAAARIRDRDLSTATLFHVIEHLPDPAGDMALLYDALPPGGHLVIETPDFSAYSFRKTGYRHKLVYPEHLFYFSPANLSRLLRNAGFEVETVKHRDFDQYRLHPYESLFRLGLRTPKPSVPRALPGTARAHGAHLSVPRQHPLAALRTPLFSLARLPLSLAVVLARRQNFMLVIARKP